MKQFSGLSRTIQGNHLLDTCAIDILKIGHRPLFYVQNRSIIQL